MPAGEGLAFCLFRHHRRDTKDLIRPRTVQRLPEGGDQQEAQRGDQHDRRQPVIPPQSQDEQQNRIGRVNRPGQDTAQQDQTPSPAGIGPERGINMFIPLCIHYNPPKRPEYRRVYFTGDQGQWQEKSEDCAQNEDRCRCKTDKRGKNKRNSENLQKPVDKSFSGWYYAQAVDERRFERASARRCGSGFGASELKNS